MRLILTVALLCWTSQAWAVNKCTGKDGAVSFQDAPCSTASQTQETVRVRNQGTISSAGSYGLAHLDMTGSAEQRLHRGMAALETLSDLSLDCKIKLQVYGPKDQTLDVCQRFVTHHKAWFDPATQALSELSKDGSWAAENGRAIQRANQFIAKINENSEFILLRMRASR